jgi:lysophospholipase L1-like esterase
VNRRQFLVTAAAAVSVAASIGATKPATTTPTTSTTQSADVPDDVVWHDVRDWGVEGRGFDDTANYFDRLPARAKGVVRDDVWNLARHTAGMSVRFETDSEGIYARYELLKGELAMGHMPATGVSGLDIYGRLDTGAWRWLAVVAPTTSNVTAAIGNQIAPGRRAYVCNLPLYNGVKSLLIGMRKGSGFWPAPTRKDKPILFYGTSITQGACASRPGMSFVNILGRRLDRPMLNFGFSGNGRMEIEVGRLLAELDPALFVIDCVANTDAGQIIDRAPPLVKLLRCTHPTTPILLLDERMWDNAPLLPALRERHRSKAAALRQAYERLRADGVDDLHFRAGDDLLGADGEATTDGSHPNDLGMMRYADALEPDLRKLLG